jgi:hypothetical protein
VEEEQSQERRTGTERRTNGIEFKTTLGSIRANGDGLLVLLVFGMFTCAGGMFYLAHLVKDQLVSFEHAQRLTLCVLAVPDTAERWEQIMRPNSECSILAKSVPVPALKP